MFVKRLLFNYLPNVQAFIYALFNLKESEGD